MAGTPPVVPTEQLGNNSFFVPTRGVDYRTLPIGGPHPMVPVAVAGDVAFYRVTQERNTMEG
jgi:hypothetical protein